MMLYQRIPLSLNTVKIVERVAFVALSALILIKTLAVDLKVGMNKLKACLVGRFSRFLYGSALTQVVCVGRITKRVWESYRDWNDPDKDKSRYWSDVTQRVCFSVLGLSTAFALPPVFQVSKTVSDMTYILAGVFACVDIGSN